MKKRTIRYVGIILTMIMMLSCMLSCGTKKTEDVSNEPTNEVNHTDTPAEDLGDSPTEAPTEALGGSPADSSTDSPVGATLQGEQNLGAIGKKTRNYSGYLGYGYHLLESAYYNQDDIKASNPIINMDKLAKADYVYIDKSSSNSNKAKTIIAHSIKEYSKEIVENAKISGKVGFTGSFSASFSMDYTSETKDEQLLITQQSILCRQRDYINDCLTKQLANFVTKNFKTAAKDMSAEDIIKTYGTHVLTDIYLGGRYELNYLYTNSAKKSQKDITTSVEAANAYIGGGADASLSSGAKEIISNSQLHLQSYGGAGADTTTIENANKSYADWLKSLDDSDKISFVDCSTAIPIWEIISYLNFEDAKDKAEEVKEQYEKLEEDYISKMKDPLSTKLYISDVYIGYDSRNADRAKTMLYGMGVPKGNVVDCDLNSGAGGDYVYLGYKTTTDPNKAIRGLCGGIYDEEHDRDINCTFKNAKYTIASKTDINKNNHAKYIYLYQSKDTKAGDPITMIRWQLNSKYEDGIDKEYSVVLCKNNSQPQDFNKTKKNSDDVFLWVTRK